MKYIRLTQEQFHALAEDFATFLAAQSIDAKSWDRLKNTDIAEVDRQLDAFSDLVWEDVLSKVKFLEHRTRDVCFVVQVNDESMSMLRFSWLDDSVDWTTLDLVDWLKAHWSHELLEISKGTKQLTENRYEEIFNLIQQGASIADAPEYASLFLMFS
ncbi:MAG: hypothetical protein RL501_60 [Bacteroidota bacterium]|jgi:hypothetical protein